MIRASCFSLLIAAVAGGAVAQQPETRYQPQIDAEILNAAAGEASETRYNPKGTASSLPIGLISTRRDAPEFPAFLLGMQQAALARYDKPLNVAPRSVQSLEDQHRVLRERGVETFLVDDPEGEASRPFFANAKFLEIEAVLVADRLPGNRDWPVVVYSEFYEALRVGEEAVRAVGDVPVLAIYATNGVAGDDRFDRQLTQFLRPFKVSAPRITVEQYDPNADQDPAVIALFREEDSAEFLPDLADQFPDATIVFTSEREKIIEGFEAGRYQVRVRPDYRAIFNTALREAKSASLVPPIMLPAADFYQDD